MSGHLLAGSQHETSKTQQLATGEANRKKRRQLQRLRQAAADADAEDLKRREAALALSRQRLVEATDGLGQQQRHRSYSEAGSGGMVVRSENAQHMELWKLDSSGGMLSGGRLEETWRLLRESPNTAATTVAKASPRKQRQHYRSHSPMQQQQRRSQSSQSNRSDAVSFAEKYRPKKLHSNRIQGRSLLSNCESCSDSNSTGGWRELRDWESHQAAMLGDSEPMKAVTSASESESITVFTIATKDLTANDASVFSMRTMQISKPFTVTNEDTALASNEPSLNPPASLSAETTVTLIADGKLNTCDNGSLSTSPRETALSMASCTSTEASATSMNNKEVTLSKTEEAEHESTPKSIVSKSMATATATDLGDWSTKLPAGASCTKASPVCTNVPVPVVKATTFGLSGSASASIGPVPKFFARQSVSIVTIEPAIPSGTPERRPSILKKVPLSDSEPALESGRSRSLPVSSRLRKSVRFSDSIASASTPRKFADSSSSTNLGSTNPSVENAEETAPVVVSEVFDENQSVAENSSGTLAEMSQPQPPRPEAQAPVPSRSLLMRRRLLVASISTAPLAIPPPTTSTILLAERRRVLATLARGSATMSPNSQSQSAGGPAVRVVHHYTLRSHGQQNFHTVSSHQQRRQATAAIVRKLEDSGVRVPGAAVSIVFPAPQQPEKEFLKVSNFCSPVESDSSTIGLSPAGSLRSPQSAGGGHCGPSIRILHQRRGPEAPG